MKELQRTLDHDEKLKDFLFHKSNDRAFAADFVEEERDRERKEAEAKDLENSKQFKEAFERIKKVVASDSSLDKIVADFIKVEDQNFALFNYVTEMNNQVSICTIFTSTDFCLKGVKRNVMNRAMIFL